jgi:alanine-synthesizing transaminase
LHAIELLASLRLCSNVPGQWAVQTALGGHQSIRELTRPGGHLHESRNALIEGVNASPYLDMVTPRGSLYGFVRVKTDAFPNFDDREFALDLLERKHILVAPGSSFNVSHRNCFRTTLLPEAAKLSPVLARIHDLLAEYAASEHGVAHT